MFLLFERKTIYPSVKNIGRIFKKHNIIEYKSPSDYLSIDDFYKVYGYACFYKSDTLSCNSILFNEISITFICCRYPVKLVHHLQKERGFHIKKEDEGIYYIYGDTIPIQFIVTNHLSERENLWLHSLTNHLKSDTLTSHLIDDYSKNEQNKLYHSIMNVIIRANKQKFQEVKSMCEALRELFADELEEKLREGQAEGLANGNKQVNDLILKLSELGRTDDIIKAAANPEYQKQLFKQFGL